MDEHKIYVHDGHSNFDINLFKHISCKENFNKPLGGLWASPVDSPYTWEQWCLDNNFNYTIGRKIMKHFYAIYDIRSIKRT